MVATLLSILSAFSPVMAEVRERTFLAIKPDGVQRGLIGKIMMRFEQRGFKLVGSKMIHPTEDLLGEHYEEHKGKGFFPKLIEYMSSGPVFAMVWEGTEVIRTCRTMMGATKPLESAPGTIRGDFAIEMGRNIIHGSDSVESAEREISLWFSEKELIQWECASDSWIYEG